MPANTNGELLNESNLKSIMDASMIFMILTLVLVMPRVSVDGRKAVTLATFNVDFTINKTYGMAERTSLLMQKIRESKADVFCLQELFLSNIQHEIVAGLSNEFPYSFSAQSLKPTNVEEPACTPEELEEVHQCMRENCTVYTEQFHTYCLISCMNLFENFRAECRNCFVLQLAKGSASCAILPASNFETNYGLLILSKKKLKNTKATPFSPISQFRGFLEASIDGVGDLTCTHLSGVYDKHYYHGPPFVYPLKYRSYDEQQYNEIQVLFDTLETKQHPILMGFFNHGPASPGNLTWKLPIHYGLLHSRGFYSPYVLEDGRCTVCTSNPAVNTTNQYDAIVDHIYLPTTTYNRAIFSKRIFDDVELPDGMPLSTHYGVQVSLTEEREDTDERETISHCQNVYHFLDMNRLSQHIEPLCVAAANGEITPNV